MNTQTAGVGGGAAATTELLPKMVVTEDGRRMRLVSEETIRKFQSSLSPPTRAGCAELFTAEYMRKAGLAEEVIENLLAAVQAMEVAMQAVRDIQMDALQQYDARGYAYLEIVHEQGVDEQVRLLTMELGRLAT